MMQRILRGELPFISLEADSWFKGKYGYVQIRLACRWERSGLVLSQEIAPWADPYLEIPF